MRVVDVTSFFSDSCGGIKTYYQAKARFLPALGVDCHFVVPGPRRTEESFGAAVLHRLPGPRLPGNRHYRLFGRLRAVIDLVARLAPDVVEVGSHYLLPGAIERLRWQRHHPGHGRARVWWGSSTATSPAPWWPHWRPTCRPCCGGN